MALKNRQAVFAYKTARGALHRAPALLKFLALLPLSVVCLALPLAALAAGIALAALTACACGFRLREQFCDLKPALFYSVLMYGLSIFSNTLEIQFPVSPAEFCIAAFTPRPDFLFMCLRLTIIVQLSALLFRSTTALQIRDSLGVIESAIRRLLSRVPLIGARVSERPRLAGNIALFAGFIPEIFQTWAQIDKAWHARGGKQGLSKIRALIFLLISLSFEKAARKALALAARGD